jgi:hypothetical protein
MSNYLEEVKATLGKARIVEVVKTVVKYVDG